MVNRVLDLIFGAVEFLLSIALLLIFAEVVIEVSARYIFLAPIPWGAEFSKTLLVWLTFLGSAAAMRRGEHMVVSLVVEAIPSPKLKKAVEILADAVMLLFLLIGIWAGWQVVMRTWALRTTALQIPAGILYLAFPVGCVLMIAGFRPFPFLKDRETQ
ncbi:MAG TPA: TRAP transporter small permease [Synergistetes bacterium]|nr:TRAP transporter small permease [Synergistota bacterium]